MSSAPDEQQQSHPYTTCEGSVQSLQIGLFFWVGECFNQFLAEITPN